MSKGSFVQGGVTNLWPPIQCSWPGHIEKQHHGDRHQCKCRWYWRLCSTQSWELSSRCIPARDKSNPLAEQVLQPESDVDLLHMLAALRLHLRKDQLDKS